MYAYKEVARIKQMAKINKNIPINLMLDNLNQGISFDRVTIQETDLKTAQQQEEASQSHRDEGHTFHIVEKGTVFVEIDFKKYEINAPAVVYMHPYQVHRILTFKDITVCSLSIKNENLNPDYLKLLEEIAPLMPLELTEEASKIVADTFTLCLNFSAQKNNKLYHSLLKNSCNTLVAFLLTQFLDKYESANSPARFEIFTKSFKQLLEKNYCTLKRPSQYAEKLNISTSYLNECIKRSSGYSVSQHIQERIILEAKRLLYHTNKSVKEIAFELGYEDYPYFTRLFAKATGTSALTFRKKNHD